MLISRVRTENFIKEHKIKNQCTKLQKFSDGWLRCKCGDFNEKNKTYDCIGESFAGNPFLKPVKKNQAIKVMTGGMVPSGCNAVVMKELITQKGRVITTKSRIIKDQNIRFPERTSRKMKLF